MLQIRLHGRGGQGVVTTAELLAMAAFSQGRYAQAFPGFGSERTGAPAAAFCRVDRQPIRAREPIARPDVVIVQDPALVHLPGVLDGLVAGGRVLVDTARAPEELGLEGDGYDLVCVPATELAREHLGRPLPGAPLVGAFARVTGALSLDSVLKAIAARFSGAAASGNAVAAQAAYDLQLVRA